VEKCLYFVVPYNGVGGAVEIILNGGTCRSTGLFENSTYAFVVLGLGRIIKLLLTPNHLQSIHQKSKCVIYNTPTTYIKIIDI
jgi:hypothetical protein